MSTTTTTTIRPQCCSLRHGHSTHCSEAQSQRKRRCRKGFNPNLKVILGLLGISFGCSVTAEDQKHSEPSDSKDIKYWWEDSSLSSDEPSYNKCNTFLALSVNPATGWGVFAGRDFGPGDIVDIAAAFVPIPRVDPITNLPSPTFDSILDDYIFGYQFPNQTKTSRLVLFGMGGFYNHHGGGDHRINIKLDSIGGGFESKPHVIGFVAKRHIRAGEELFVSYGLEDGGKQWFASRGLQDVLKVQQETSLEKFTGNEGPFMTSIQPTVLRSFFSQFCSKAYGGIGQSTWNEQIMPTFYQDPAEADSTTNEKDNGRHTRSYSPKSPLQSANFIPPRYNVNDAAVKQLIPPLDAPIGEIRVKTFVAKGDVIESTSIGLFFLQSQLQGTALAPLAIYWDDLTVHQQDTMVVLRHRDQMVVRSKPFPGKIDGLRSFTDLVILPTGGVLGLVRRVGRSSPDSNCRLSIPWHQGSHQSSTGIRMELIATKDIAEGQVLKIDLPPFVGEGAVAIEGFALKQRYQDMKRLEEVLTRTYQRFSFGSVVAEESEKVEENREEL